MHMYVYKSTDQVSSNNYKSAKNEKECRIEVKVRLQTAMLQGMLLGTFSPWVMSL